MTLSELSLKRPVFATVMSLVIVLLGLVSIRFLGVREYPAVDPPQVRITTLYPGAAPETIDSSITEPIEQSVYGVAGISSVASTSRDGASDIRVEFDLGVNLEAAANDVRDKVALARKSLPPDVDPPIVEKADADSDPIIFLTLSSSTRNILDVSYYADAVVKERIQTIPGVALVRIFGEKRYAMRVALDSDKMAAHDVSPADVEAAVAAENVELPAGRFEGAWTEVGLRFDGRLGSAEEFDDLIVKKGPGRPVRLGDIGHASLGPENPRTGVRKLGEPFVGIAVIPQPNTDAIAIADEFLRRYEGIKAELPEGVNIDIGYDFTRYVRRSIREVVETLGIAFVLVALIIFAFLRNLRATLVPVVAIPISIVSAFFVMYLANFTINTLTLVALVLAIGLVCDDAIVVLENIYKKVESGQDPLLAAQQGSREIFFAVVATTLALVAVFLPVLFLEGLTGRLFREFGVVLAGAVVVSSFVALTLTPVMCRYFLRRSRGAEDQERLDPSSLLYGRILGGFLRVRWLIAPILLLIGVASHQLFTGLSRELTPLEDRSNIRVSVLAPEGSSFEYTERALDRVAQWVVDNVPEMSKTFSIAARGGGPVNSGIQNVYLVDADQRTRTQAEIAQDFARLVQEVDEVRVFPSQPPTIGRRFGGQPLSYVLQAPTLEQLTAVLPGFLQAAAKRPELRFVDADLKVSRAQANLVIDRDRAAELGISAREIARAVQLTFGEQRLGYFSMRGRQYQVIGQLDRGDRNEPTDLRRLHVRSQSGRLVSLDQVASWQETTSPSAIYRFNRRVAATISGSPAPGYTLGDALNALDELAKTLPQEVTVDLSGEAKDLAASSSSLLFGFLLALILSYLVLAAQFESFIDPLVILVTVPLATIGALLALKLTGFSLNLFSQIGLIMLIGLITKNGILIVEFANQKQEAGLDALSAVIEAARARFRPIAMTTVSTLLGVAPIAFSLGSSSGSRQSLGVAVLGGVLVGTLFTLFVIPAVYSYLSRGRVPVAQEREATLTT